jgi:hypothetical protein
MDPARRWYRFAAGWLLVAAGAHLAGHWVFYLDVDGFSAERRAVMQAMQAYVVFAPTGASLWTVLQMFSLAFAALLALAGCMSWFDAREADAWALQRHAIRNALLCGVALLAIAALHPVPQALGIFGGATILFALAARPRPRPPGA